MPRLAHISDIHFGRTFDVDVWARVRQAIITSRPKIIIASGDFTDNPDPLLLLAAKFDLQDLCGDCGPGTEFFVVPGNHDLLDMGNVWHPGAAWWFNRVMFNDTTGIRAKLEDGLDFKLGLNEQTLHWARRPQFVRLNPGNWIWKQKCDGRLQSCDYRRGGNKWPSQSVHDQTLITCFNSNAFSFRSFVFATGQIGGGQITRIGSDPARRDCPDCGARATADPAPSTDSAIHLRVAVMHHHALPIAIPYKSSDGKLDELKLEPFLVLKNGGDVIHELQRQKYDIILHGHKHRPQFARIELRADDPEDYPLLVLAGGSAAKQDEDASDNTLRLIRTESDGRLKIATYEEGVEGRNYDEPLVPLKSRSYVRAIERAGISAEELLSEVAIDAVGHLRSLDRTTDLKVNRNGLTLDGVAINVLLEARDERQQISLEESCRDFVKLTWRDVEGRLYGLRNPDRPKNGYCWLEFLQPRETNSKPISFGIREAAANSIAMTRWELAERTRGSSNDPNYDEARTFEQVGYYINYPVKTFTLRLQFPEGMDDIIPDVRCHRHPDFPRYPLTFRPEQRQFKSDPRTFAVEGGMAREESNRLRYDAAQRSWSLEIDRPMAGHIYSLRWRVPNLIASETAVNRTRAFQRLLRTLAEDTQTAKPNPVAQRCQSLFVELANELMARFHSKINPHELQSAFLMVYDETRLSLRPVLTHMSSGALPKDSFEVPLGGGVAGAAFLQRRILTWKNDPDSESLIRPPKPEILNSNYVLALPIFYQSSEFGNLELDVRPGAVIGVVTLGSDEPASGISKCAGDDRPSKEIGQEAQGLAQAYVLEILDLLSKG